MTEQVETGHKKSCHTVMLLWDHFNEELPKYTEKVTSSTDLSFSYLSLHGKKSQHHNKVILLYRLILGYHGYQMTLCSINIELYVTIEDHFQTASHSAD